MADDTVLEAALEAYRSGWLPVPIVGGQKRPALSSWSHQEYENEESVVSTFKGLQAEHDHPLNVGLVLGESSNGLVDVDLDHPKALRLRDQFLPHTEMVSGRTSARRSHYWYIVTDDLPEGTRRYKMPDGSTSVELRSTGGQTLIPPTVARCLCQETGKRGGWCKEGHLATPEPYLWEDAPWGGEQGPARINGRVLSIRVATLALACVVVDGWPSRGGRHDAFLALAGGLLRYGHDGEGGAIHPLWEQALPNLIKVIAVATNDEDGPNARASEVMGSTLERLRIGGKAQGFPTLARLIGEPHVDLIRRYAREIETLAGHAVRPEKAPTNPPLTEGDEAPAEDPGEKALRLSLLPPEERRPLEERDSSWEPVDLGPYLDGEVQPPQPTILRREDGLGLFYPGRVNYLYGASESGKTWVTFAASKEVIDDGGRVLFIDCEDDPTTAIMRLRTMGMAADDLRQRFTYVRPEGPLGALSRNSYGEPNPSEEGRRNHQAFIDALAAVEPDLVIVDGLTVLYGLHGLNTNDASNTEVITGFMRSLTKSGDRTVIVIDHTSKGAGRGSMPMGSQHKIAMVQGTAIQVHPITKPRIGHIGEIELIVGKDRPGVVRGASAGNDPHVAAVVTLDSTQPGRLVMRFKTPTDAVVVGDSDRSNERLELLAKDSDDIIAALRSNAGASMSRNELVLAITRTIPVHRMKQALKSLRDSGVISVDGAARSTAYSLTDGY